ncbi:MAG TPA: xylulokinase [Geminicoccaceae bacterium]|nr:xylulokinase [Geminicoccaceae bacterium]
MLHAIGFDLGTSGLKAVLVDERGRVVKSARQSYALQIPEAGWAEQHPDLWWQALLATCRQLLDGGPAPDAIGLAGQMHSAVVLGADDAPLAPAILWNDQRTVEECADLEERLGGSITTWTGNPIRTAFTATKVLWLRRHHPDLYGRLSAILLPKDFLRLGLTGVRATDVTDASGTGVFDVHRRRWSDDALAALGIPRAWMPDAFESPTMVSRIDRRGARSSGLRAGTPVAAGAGDQAAAALGSGAVEPDTLSITLGTSAAVQLPTALPLSDPTGVFQTFCHGLPGRWQVLAAVLSGGGSFDWYHRVAKGSDGVASLERDEGAAFKRLCRIAATAPAGACGLVFLPYLTGEAAPHLDPEARGAWFGLTRRHDHRHLARAVIEGVAFGVRGVVEAAEALAGKAQEVRVSGGASHGRIWLRTFANVLGRRITAVGAGDSSARGAALLAVAAATGNAPQALAAEWSRPCWSIDPEPPLVARYQAQYAIFRELYPATRHLMHRLTGLDRESGSTTEVTRPPR